MSTVDILFYLLSAFAIVSATMVLISKNPIHSVLWLILVFFAISGHYILLNAQFLAIVNIIVYAGAIMVLFLFVIMLMNIKKDAEPQKQLLVKLTGVNQINSKIEEVCKKTRKYTKNRKYAKSLKVKRRKCIA